jgi:hypothetical protein
MKLNDLKPTPSKFKLEHPIAGELEYTITLRGTDSNEYANVARASIAFSDTEDIEKKIEIATKLTACLVVDWDVEFFEKPCTPENVYAVLVDYENKWLREFIDGKAADRTHFFKSPSKK